MILPKVPLAATALALLAFAAKIGASPPVLVISGTPSLIPLLEAWSQDWAQDAKGVQLRVQSTTNEEAAAALTAGAASVAAMSRPMMALETKAFAVRHGKAPRPVRVALDAVVLIVNPVNPIQGLTLAQLSGMFSEQRRCAGADEISTWGQILPSGLWRTRPVRPFAPGNGYGDVQQLLRELTLCGGTFKASVNMSSGASEVVEKVRDEANAVGIIPMAFLAEGVRAVPLAAKDATLAVAPDASGVRRGAYPLSRYLYLYMRDASEADSPACQFILRALSGKGQSQASEAGFVALPEAVASGEMAKLCNAHQ